MGGVFCSKVYPGGISREAISFVECDPPPDRPNMIVEQAASCVGGFTGMFP